MRRRRLRTWLNDAISRAGGSAERVWRENDKTLSAAETILELERVRGALGYAEARLQSCPFWLEADTDFAGVQSARGHFRLLLESMGGLQLVLDDEVFLGGAGGARLIPMIGVGSLLGVGLGAEVGAASTFPRSEDGVRRVKAVFTVGLPLILRLSDGPWRFDTELAGTLRIPDGDGPMHPGMRVSLAFGTTTVRVAGFMPYAMLWAGYEWFPDRRGVRGFSVIRAGPRVGADWGP